MPEDNGKASIEERVNIIQEELSLGIQWDRPSLIVIIYRSEHIKNHIQSLLSKRLEKSGQTVFFFSVDKLHYDIPLEMINHSQHEKAVYFVSGLRWGGGRGYSNAFRALNMHREYLIDGNIRAVFWLPPKEAKQLSRFAPDFWAFRHKVMEFSELPSPNEIPKYKSSINHLNSLYTNNTTAFRLEMEAAKDIYAKGCIDEATLLYRKILQKYPDQIAIYLQLAEINISMGWISAANRMLKKAGKVKNAKRNFLQELNRLSLAANSGKKKNAGFLELAR
jgi:hypothetical protein